MVKFTKSNKVDIDRYDEEINARGYILFDTNKAIDILDYLEIQINTLYNRAVFEMKLCSSCKYLALNKESIYRFLTDSMRCPERYFHTGKTQSYSIDKSRVLQKLRDNGYAVEFLDEYMAYSSAKSKYNSFQSLARGPFSENIKGKYGMLNKIPFECAEQTNLRFNYHSFDIISQIPKEACDVISVEEGYFLAWGDFAQSDFRIAYNLFIRSPENDKIMNKYDDKYEALARIVKRTLGQKFDYDEFKASRGIYKRLTLATIYGTRSSSVAEEQEFITVFSQFLSKCPKYSEFYKRLSQHLVLKSPIPLVSYFGHEQYIMYHNTSENRTLYEALNSPIQTGTSEIVIQTVLSLIDMAREQGLSEDDFSLYLTRHDEPIFRISEKAIDKLWILKEHETIIVDNWSPLQMDFKFGYQYKNEDEELTRRVSRAMNSHDITIIPIGSGESDYYPLKAVFDLSLHWVTVGDKTVVTFAESEGNRAIFVLFETNDEEEIIQNVRIRIRDCITNFDKKYGTVIIRNRFFDKEDFFNDVHIVYLSEINTNLIRVTTLCDAMVNEYCKRHDLEIPQGVIVRDVEFPPQLSELVQTGD